MELLHATLETLEMSLVSLLLSYTLGLPLGVLTNETRRNGLIPNRIINFFCEILIGVGRAIPFTILMVLVLPLTRFLVGTGVGTTATIVPLTIAATPFVARIIAMSLREVDDNIVKAAKIDQASKLKILVLIKLGSRLYDIVDSLGVTSVAIVSYTTIAGTLGGGGLGNYAITKGYYQYDWFSVLYATVIIVVIVIVFQLVFTSLSNILDWRNKSK